MCVELHTCQLSSVVESSTHIHVHFVWWQVFEVLPSKGHICSDFNLVWYIDVYSHLRVPVCDGAGELANVWYMYATHYNYMHQVLEDQMARANVAGLVWFDCSTVV